jgi:hypothetical protein
VSNSSEVEISALSELGREFRRLAAAESLAEVGPRPARTYRARLVLALAALLAVTGFSLTPPGRAIAERVGELVGIGEPSSVKEANLRDPRLNGQDLVGPVLVAASGTIPDTDQSFEIVAWAARKKPEVLSPQERASWRARLRLLKRARREPSSEALRDRLRGQIEAMERQLKAGVRLAPVNPATAKRRGFQFEEQQPTLLSCLGIVFPELGSQETGKYCAEPSIDVDEVTKPVHVFGMGPLLRQDFGADAPYEIVGVTEPDVQRIEVTYVNKAGSRVNAPVTLGRLDGELLEKTGAEYPFGFFVAFIPYDGAPIPTNALTPSPALQSVYVTAFDEDGHEVGHDDAGAG